MQWLDSCYCLARKIFCVQYSVWWNIILFFSVWAVIIITWKKHSTFSFSLHILSKLSFDFSWNFIKNKFVLNHVFTWCITFCPFKITSWNTSMTFFKNQSKSASVTFQLFLIQTIILPLGLAFSCTHVTFIEVTSLSIYLLVLVKHMFGFISISDEYSIELVFRDTVTIWEEGQHLSSFLTSETKVGVFSKVT